MMRAPIREGLQSFMHVWGLPGTCCSTPGRHMARPALTACVRTPLSSFQRVEATKPLLPSRDIVISLVHGKADDGAVTRGVGRRR